MKKILVLGGSGFVGRHVCEKAAALHCRLTVPTRRRDCAKELQTMPWVDAVVANVHDEAALTQLVAGHDAVVNLVAILHGSEAEFAKVHVQLVQKLVRACQANGVHRVVHVSALGAKAEAPSMYLRSKAQGEAVLNASTLDVTILRPSVIFGAGDQFLNMFANLQTLFPVMPVAGAATRFQPVWVEDVAQAIVNALGKGDATPTGHTVPPVIEACGPDVFTLKELVQMAGRMAGHERTVFALPAALGRLQARLMEFAPGKPLMSRDNIDSMSVDSVANAGVPGLEALDISPSAIGAVAPGYLSTGPRDRLQAMRRLAGRF